MQGLETVFAAGFVIFSWVPFADGVITRGFAGAAQVLDRMQVTIAVETLLGVGGGAHSLVTLGLMRYFVVGWQRVLRPRR